MPELPDESGHTASPPSRPASDPGLWTRLRESMERLAKVGKREVDPVALNEKLAARSQRLRDRMAIASTGEAMLRFLAFNKGRHRYGVPIDNIIEVHSLEHFTPVPGTPAFIEGVIHWRGEVLALLDLGKLFGIPESGLADIHVAVIVQAAGRRVAIVALEIEDIVTATQRQVASAPELPSGVPGEWLIGVYDNNCVLVDLGTVLQDARLVQWRKE